MRAQRVVSLDGPAGLELAEVPEPEGRGRVLIEVAAAGVSFPDLLLSRGEYQLKPSLPFIPGVEVAGHVRSAPPGSNLRAGDRVAAVVGLGGFAEVVAAEPGSVIPVPGELDLEQAAGFILNYHTAHFALSRRGRVGPGETVAVHGAAGGVGTAALQVGRGLGARVIALVSSAGKAEVARRAGAEEVVDALGDWGDELRRLTGGRGVDVILDPVGGARFDQSLRCLAPEGRLLTVGFTEGRIPSVAANRLLLRNISVVGVAWGAFLSVEPGLLAATEAALRPMIAAGVVRPLVGAVVPLDRAADALRLLEERRALGKVVLSVPARAQANQPPVLE
jgi:NADPH2:quinone reductase